MRALGTLPSLRISRNPLVALALFVLVIFAAYKAAEAILSGDLSSLAFAALLFVGGAVFIAILNDWRRGLYLLVAWILFEDFVRKYLGNNMAIYFAKDILALVLIPFIFSCPARQTGRGIQNSISSRFIVVLLVLPAPDV